ncbi:head morphogenesis protein [Devosia sp. Root105]|uniref:head morphogenesis protein n=1 Tax=Devosia sp. Root105 TaxID=1736423 RepID=UPI0006F7BF90|nr:head morphogenesis protein [Devosia sp. Root105]KQU96440.1 head morphogenesis protein [Devosia sp. Root105]
MLKRLSQHERLVLLIAEFEPKFREAFFAVIAEIKSSITLRVLVERLERNDILGAVDALQIEPEAFARVEVAIAEAYNGGGMAMAESLLLRDPQGHRIAFRFGVRNPEAEAWLRTHSAALVTHIVEDQRDGIRQALAEGLAQGNNPRVTALGVVGRINRVSGKREGGIIGLTSPQERFVAAARAELLSGDPAQLRNYLTRERRDKRFDGAVRRAISSEKPVGGQTVVRMVGRYADRLLALRGELLARTETMFALGQSRDDAMRQAIRAGKVSADLVTKHWRSAGDSRVRHTHRVLNGNSVGFYEAFQSPSGVQLRFPGDPQAPISETSGCRCSVEYKVDYAGQLLRRLAA